MVLCNLWETCYGDNCKVILWDGITYTSTKSIREVVARDQFILFSKYGEAIGVYKAVSNPKTLLCGCTSVITDLIYIGQPW